MVSRLFVFDLFLGIGLFLIGLVQQVINAGMIEVCQLDEDTSGEYLVFPVHNKNMQPANSADNLQGLFDINHGLPANLGFVGIASSTSIFLLLYDKIRVEIDK